MDFRRLRAELTKFGTVGGFAYIIDVGLFNLLRFSDMSPINDKPITSKIVSAGIATLFAYAGNRYWTFKHREAKSHAESLPVFVGLNLVGMAIAAICLGVSHYLLGFTSPAADNIAANVVGTGFGTLFRFWGYRRFVFTAPTS